jgi:hypothetical protein
MQNQKFLSPFFSHATKEFEYFVSIVQSGAILCSERLTSVRKFSKFTDQYIGRSLYVMLAPGFGYLIDNANMKVSFLFSQQITDIPGAVLHKKPSVYEICLIISRFVKVNEREKWLYYFKHHNETLERYNHPLLKVTFRDYMLSFLTSYKEIIEFQDVWGPSAFSEGIIKILYEENTKYKEEIKSQIEAFNRKNIIKGKGKINYFLKKNWQKFNIYRSPTDTPLSNNEKTHLQMLIPEDLPIWNTSLIGMCVSPKYLVPFIEILIKIRECIPEQIKEALPIIVGDRLFPITNLLKNKKLHKVCS